MFSDVSSSFQSLADENDKSKYITTAGFVKIVSKWFSLTTSRCCSALKKDEKILKKIS